DRVLAPVFRSGSQLLELEFDRGSRGGDDLLVVVEERDRDEVALLDERVERRFQTFLEKEPPEAALGSNHDTKSGRDVPCTIDEFSARIPSDPGMFNALPAESQQEEADQPGINQSRPVGDACAHDRPSSRAAPPAGPCRFAVALTTGRKAIKEAAEF